MKFALLSLVMNIPNAISVDSLTEAEQREQVERFATEVAPVVRREVPSTVWRDAVQGAGVTR